MMEITEIAKTDDKCRFIVTCKDYEEASSFLERMTSYSSVSTITHVLVTTITPNILKRKSPGERNGC